MRICNYNSKRGSAALIMVALLSMTILIGITYMNFSPKDSDIALYHSKISSSQFNMGEGEALLRFNEDPSSFLEKYDVCDRKSAGVPVSYTNENEQNGDFLRINTAHTYDNSLLSQAKYANGRGFLNRKCTVFQSTYPYEGIESITLNKGEYPTLPIESDDNGFFRAKIVDRDFNKGFLFTADTMYDVNSGILTTERNPKFVVSFNILSDLDMNEIGNTSFLLNESKVKDIYALLEDRGIEQTKENLLQYFRNEIENISSSAKIEVGIVSYDGNLGADGFSINTINAPEVIKRCICEATDGNSCTIDMSGAGVGVCSIPRTDIQNNKLYFFYIKTLDKGTSISFQVQDSMGNEIAIPSSDLSISGYGDSEKNLVKEVRVHENVFGTELASAIFNYLFYSQN